MDAQVNNVYLNIPNLDGMISQIYLTDIAHFGTLKDSNYLFCTSIGMFRTRMDLKEIFDGLEEIYASS